MEGWGGGGGRDLMKFMTYDVNIQDGVRAHKGLGTRNTKRISEEKLTCRLHRMSSEKTSSAGVRDKEVVPSPLTRVP